MTLRSILSPVDFSEQSRHALRWAGAFAARFHARLTVLSVVDPLLAQAARIRLGQDLAIAETEPALREFVAASWPDRTAPSVQTSFKTAIGNPVAVIGETATDEAIDLIVMGTQGSVVSASGCSDRPQSACCVGRTSPCWRCRSGTMQASPLRMQGSTSGTFWRPLISASRQSLPSNTLRSWRAILRDAVADARR